MSGKEKLTWRKIAERIAEIQFAANNIACVEVQGKKICIGKFRGRVFAFAYQCPHAGGFLVSAEIDQSGNLVCPMHQYKFDMINGRNVTGEGYHLMHWPLEVRADGIYIEVNDETFWN